MSLCHYNVYFFKNDSKDCGEAEVNHMALAFKMLLNETPARAAFEEGRSAELTVIGVV